MAQVTEIEGTPASNVAGYFLVTATKYLKGYYQATDTSSPDDAIED